MSKETGGYAFPIPNADFHTFQPESVDEYKRIQSGMTLLDYFAAKAMQGILANSGMIDNVTPDAAKWVAKEAYQVADAMIAERASNS